MERRFLGSWSVDGAGGDVAEYGGDDMIAGFVGEI